MAVTQSKMAYCATIHSSPPKVCTNCINEYIDFKQIEYMTHQLVNYILFSYDLIKIYFMKFVIKISCINLSENLKFTSNRKIIY